MQCSHCGGTLEARAKTCPFCGRAFRRRRPSKGNMRASLALLITAVAGAGGFSLYAVLTGDADGFSVALTVGAMLLALALFCLISFGR